MRCSVRWVCSSRYPPGKELVRELFDENANPARLQSFTRVNLSTCKALIEWLKQNTSLHDSIRGHQLDAREKVLILLFICSHGATFRAALEIFGHSICTISTTFHVVLKALLKFPLQLITLPSGQPPSEIRENPNWMFCIVSAYALDRNSPPFWLEVAIIRIKPLPYGLI